MPRRPTTRGSHLRLLREAMATPSIRSPQAQSCVFHPILAIYRIFRTHSQCSEGTRSSSYSLLMWKSQHRTSSSVLTNYLFAKARTQSQLGTTRTTSSSDSSAASPKILFNRDRWSVHRASLAPRTTSQYVACTTLSSTAIRSSPRRDTQCARYQPHRMKSDLGLSTQSPNPAHRLHERT